MTEPEDMLDIEKVTKRVNLGLAHAQLTRFGAPTRSEADKDKLFKSLFISRAEYEQYANDLREREARERKEAEGREIARQVQVENDPKHWKRLYQAMVEREKQQKRNRDMWIGTVITVAAFTALSLAFSWLLGYRW